MATNPSTDKRAPDHAADPRHLILGTAGHIDHGKTSLVRQLTGVDTDRLPEEQRRGMTIDLGFADLSVGDFHFGIVDVPGHERFVRTMVAGATGIDLALLVVAADDSVMPQTIEHVEILDLLGVEHGVVAITKTDLVDAELVELVADEVAELLASTSLSGAPAIAVSSITGAGLTDLQQALAQQAGNVPLKETAGPFQMAIDRVFTIQGRGTVVTGSVYQGRVQAGDNLEVWPGGHSCRVRGLQSHGRDDDALQVGQRAALNLIGLDREQLQRGCELATPGSMTPTTVFHGRIRLLQSCRRALKSYGRARLCIGTRESPATIVMLDGDALAPGGSAYVQIRVASPIAVAHGQRFILRDETAVRTLGGGRVLRCVARRRIRNRRDELDGLERLATGDAADRVEEILRAAGFARPPDLQLAVQAGVEPEQLDDLFSALTSAGRWVTIAGTDRQVARGALDGFMRRGRRRLERYHERHAQEVGCPVDVFKGWLERGSAPGLGHPLLERMVDAKTVKQLGRYVCLPEHAPAMSAQDEKLLDKMLERFESLSFQPPTVAAVAQELDTNVDRVRRLIRIAISTAQLVEVGRELYLHAECEHVLRQRVRDLVAEHGAMSVGQLRESLGSSRKYVVPFLEYLDRVGVTRRDGDARRLVENANVESAQDDA